VQRWATFDCYGTLIDWNGGVRAALTDVFGPADVEALLARYHVLEPELEADGTRTYRDVMTEAMRQLGAPAGREHELAESLPAWEAFPDARPALEEARRRGWRVAILSNTDPDLIAASQVQIGVPFDEVVVASEIASYKPAHKHWQEFFARTGAPREGHVHVAQSYFHDVVPAHELDLRCVWVNRSGQPPAGEAAPTRELRDLTGLADVLDELVPG
jgi:2-haloacid dehalogenase